MSDADLWVSVYKEERLRPAVFGETCGPGHGGESAELQACLMQDATPGDAGRIV